MSEHDFHFGGLLRSMQADVGGIMIFLIVMCLLYAVVRYVITSASEDEIDTAAAKKTLNRIFLVILIVSAVGFVLTTLGRTANNRLPREDVDKSGVYSQMDSHLNH